MKLNVVVIALAAIVLACASNGTTALAQPSRVFVAAQGSDGNPCTFALPCRTFQHAHDVVAANGEIDVLDPAGYGAVTITKAISIQGHGFSGVSVASGGTGITINAGPNDAISLNGLLLDGVGVGQFGIVFSGGKSLSVENCIARNFAHSGIDVGSNFSATLVLTVSNSYFADNAANGILLQPNGTGAITASIDRTVLSGNAFAGLNLIGNISTGGVRAAVTDSVAANNISGSNGVGFLVQSAVNQSVSNLALTRSTAIGNSVGVAANGTNATLRLGQSTVTGNTTSYTASGGGVVSSYADNYIDDNIFINTAPPPITKK